MADQQQTNPLAGLTEDEADEAIARFSDKLDQQQASLDAARDHLALMESFRDQLTSPDPAGNGIRVDADPARISIKAGEG